ncbi:MAG TPA: nucleotidyltransferase domain-containing protein [Bryobacteraceae bacterium]
MAVVQRLPVEDARLDEYCRRWRIARLELFGSMLHEPSRAQDVDLLVTFAPGARWGLFEHERMERELSELLGRKVDLISRRAIESSENVLRRNSILADAVPVYVSG